MGQLLTVMLAASRVPALTETGEEHASLTGERWRGRGGVRSLPRAHLSLLAVLSLRLSGLRLLALSSTLCSERLLHMRWMSALHARENTMQLLHSQECIAVHLMAISTERIPLHEIAPLCLVQDFIHALQYCCQCIRPQLYFWCLGA